MASEGKSKAAIFFFVGTVLACLASTHAVPTTAVMMESAATIAPSSSATPLQLFNDVIMGVKVIERLNKENTRSFGIPVNNATLERGYYAFYALFQAMNTIDMLSRYGVDSDSLSTYRIVIEGIMNDTCKWFASQSNGTIDCSSPSSMATLYLTLGLKPHLSNLGCFVTSLPNLQTGQELTNWVPRVFSGQNQRLGCQLCSAIKLTDCSCNSAQQ